MKNKEVGVWIVYDLEANRKIQKLLIENNYEFRFDPDLEVTNKQQKKESIEMIDKFAEDSDIDGRGISFSFYDSDLRDLKQQLKGGNKK